MCGKHRKAWSFCGDRGNSLLPVIILASTLLGGCAATGGADGVAELHASNPVADAQAAQARSRLLQLGEQALAAGDYRDAFVNYSRLLNLEPEDPEALVGLGESYLGAKNWPKAAEAFGKVRQAPRVQALALQGEALAVMMLGQRDAASRLLRDAVALDARLWRSWNALGQYYDLTENWSAAADAYANALQHNPKSPAVHNNRGVSMLMQGQFIDAVEAFDTALRLDPMATEARENRRLALAFLGRYVEATVGIPHQQREKAFNNVGYIAMQQHDYAAAEQFLNEAMQTSAAYYQMAAENLEELKFRKLMGSKSAE